MKLINGNLKFLSIVVAIVSILTLTAGALRGMIETQSPYAKDERWINETLKDHTHQLEDIQTELKEIKALLAKE